MLSGMIAEIEYLAKERFTGQIVYWRDGEELRRKMENTYTESSKDLPDARVSERVLEIGSRLKEWIAHPESSRMTILFSRGYMRKLKW